MPKFPQIQRRLNVSLLEGDPVVLEKLRTIYESRMCKRISWAEVVRIAYHSEALKEGIINEAFFNTNQKQ